MNLMPPDQTGHEAHGRFANSKWGFPRCCQNCSMAKLSRNSWEQASNFLEAMIEWLYMMKRDKLLAEYLIK
jgi:hypothetical protein